MMTSNSDRQQQTQSTQFINSSIAYNFMTRLTTRTNHMIVTIVVSIMIRECSTHHDSTQTTSSSFMFHSQVSDGAQSIISHLQVYLSTETTTTGVSNHQTGVLITDRCSPIIKQVNQSSTGVLITDRCSPIIKQVNQSSNRCTNH